MRERTRPGSATRQFQATQQASTSDVLGCLRETIPTPSRSALHRCLQRHGISRLPWGEEKASKRKRFAETKIGSVHIDVCELRLAEGKLFMFLAIDRVSTFVHVAFFDANGLPPLKWSIPCFGFGRGGGPSDATREEAHA